MQLLKSLVIGLGVLILLGLTLLTYGFIQKVGDPQSETDLSALKPFGTLDLRLPEGCAIIGVSPEDGLVYLTIGPNGPCNRVIVVDTVRGRVLGAFKPGP